MVIYRGKKSWAKMAAVYGASYSNNADKIRNDLVDQHNTPVSMNGEPYDTKGFNARADGELAQVKTVLERRLYRFKRHSCWRRVRIFTDKNNYTNQYVTNGITTADDNFKAAFAEADIYITNDLAAKFGGRFEHSSLAG